MRLLAVVLPILLATSVPPAHGADFVSGAGGHQGAVMSLSVSPDGGKIVTSGEDKTVRLWEAASGRQLAVMEGSRHLVFAAAFSPDGSMIASAGGDKEIRLWNSDGGAAGQMSSFFNGHSLPITALTWTKDGRFVVAGSIDGSIKLWDVSQKKVAATLDGHQANMQNAETTGALCVYVPKSCNGPVCTSAHKECKLGVMALAATAGGQLISGGGDGVVKVWDLAGRRVLKTLPGDGQPVLSLAASPDGKLALAGTAGNELRFIDVEAGKQTGEWAGHSDDVTAIAFSPDGSQALSGSRDATVKLWSVASGEAAHSFEEHSGEVRAVAFSPDGRAVYSAGLDGGIKRWTKGPAGETEVASAPPPPKHKPVASKPVEFAKAPPPAPPRPPARTPEPEEAPAPKKPAAEPAPAPTPAPRSQAEPAKAEPAEEEEWWAVPDEEGGKVAAKPAANPPVVHAPPAPRPVEIAKAPLPEPTPAPAPKPVVKAPPTAKPAPAPVAKPAPAPAPEPAPVERGPFDPKAKPASPSAQVALSGSIVGGGKCALKVTVYNSGPGPAQDLRLVFSKPSMPGVKLQAVSMGTVKADESAVAEVPVEAAEDIPDGHVKFVLRIEEKNGFDSKPIALGFETHAKAQ